jgi:hypothetical protein
LGGAGLALGTISFGSLLGGRIRHAPEEATTLPTSR